MNHPALRIGSGFATSSPHLRDEVRFLQRKLVSFGYAIIADGEFGFTTAGAVKHFQRKNGLDDDGVVGSRTWNMLLGREPRNVGAGFAAPPTTNPEPTPAVLPKQTGSGGAAWMAIAKGEIGQHEVKGKAANSRIIEYHAATTLKAKSDEVAWCSSFVNWVLAQAGITGTRSASAASWVSWGEKGSARYGAIAVIYNAGAANSSLSTSGNHVGFLVEETPTHYVLLGGNQSDSVKVSNFAKRSWKVKAYRWPALASTSG